MRKASFFLSLSLILTLINCGDELDIPDNPLEGQIDGMEWSYGSANAYRLTTDGQFRARFLSKLEAVSDPCTRPSPGLTHVKAIFRPALGVSYSVAPQAIDQNQVQVAFEISASKTLIATSGFMEVYDINNSVLVGYLQAQLDDGNKVEGAFQMSLCD